MAEQRLDLPAPAASDEPHPTPEKQERPPYNSSGDLHYDFLLRRATEPEEAPAPRALNVARHRQAAAAYQRSSKLLSKSEGHAPFHFEELATAPKPTVQPAPTPEDARPPRRRRTVYYKPTRFFPGGDEDRGQIEAINPIRRARLQRIIPSYDLSTEETRESGEGPALELIEHRPPLPRHSKKPT